MGPDAWIKMVLKDSFSCTKIALRHSCVGTLLSGMFSCDGSQLLLRIVFTALAVRATSNSR